MLACVSSESAYLHETIRTLQFSMGVAKIKNRPVLLLNPHEKMISDLREEVKRLREENSLLRTQGGLPIPLTPPIVETQILEPSHKNTKAKSRRRMKIKKPTKSAPSRLPSISKTLFDQASISLHKPRAEEQQDHVQNLLGSLMEFPAMNSTQGDDEKSHKIYTQLCGLLTDESALDYR